MKAYLILCRYYAVYEEGLESEGKDKEV